MSVSIIVAMTDDRVIGVNNRLPWRLPEDLKRFKAITMGHSIIMGRKTFESIGKALPGRENIVVSRNEQFQADGVRVAHSLEEALSLCTQAKERFVIGGAALFEAALPLAERIYMTLIHKKIDGDTFFPDVDLAHAFSVMSRSEPHVSAEENIPYSYLTVERRIAA